MGCEPNRRHNLQYFALKRRPTVSHKSLTVDTSIMAEEEPQPAEKKPSLFSRIGTRLYGLGRIFILAPMAVYAPQFYLAYKGITGIYQWSRRRGLAGTASVLQGTGNYAAAAYGDSVLGSFFPLLEFGTGIAQFFGGGHYPL